MAVIARMLKPATTDALTGVNNRQSFLSQVKDRLSEHRQIPYAFIMDTAVPSVRNLGRYHTDTVEHALARILDGPGYDW